MLTTIRLVARTFCWRNMLLHAAVPMAIFAVCSYAQPRLFDDDFENGDISGWTDVATTGAGSSISVVRGDAHSGTHSLRSVLGHGAQDIFRTAAVRVLHAVSTRTTYLRFYVRLDSDFTLPPNNTVRLAELIETSNWSSVKVEVRNLSNQLFLAADGVLFGGGALSAGVWHSLEIAYVADPGQGSLSLSIDGKAEGTARVAKYVRVNCTRVGLITADAGVAGGARFDDVAVSDEPIGSPAASIRLRHANTFGRTAIRIHTVLSGHAPEDQLVMTLDGREVFRKAGGIRGLELPTVTLGNLQAGVYRLEVCLLTQNGIRKTRAMEDLRKYGDGVPKVAIDENNALVYKGEKLFPVTPFMQNPPEWERYRKSGLVNLYGWASGYARTYSVEQYRTFMEAVGAPVIGPNARFSPGGPFPINHPDALENITTYVRSLKSHPNTFMWTWVDEPDLGGAHPRVSPERVAAVTEACHEIDPDHPVALNLYGYQPRLTRQKGFLYPRLVADVYAFDVYPSIYYDGTDRYPNYTRYTELIDTWQRYNFGLTPWFSFVETANNPGTSGPTAAQLRMQVWLNVVHGIKGISWWGPWVPPPPENQAEMAKFVNQIGRLKDVVLSEESAREYSDTANAPGRRVDVMVREDATDVWVFAVRLTDFGEEELASLNVDFRVSGLGNGSAEVFDEGRAVPVERDAFSDSFGPHQVHIYRIPKSSPSRSVEVGPFQPVQRFRHYWDSR